MRVTGGKGKGIRLKTPAGRTTRPTSAKVRQAVFNILGSVEGLVMADLFAGSGAVGFEALARGAAEVTFVERAATAARILRENARRLGFWERTRVIRGELLRILPTLNVARFDLIFVDPPYREAEFEPLLQALANAGARPDVPVVLQHPWSHPPPEVPGWRTIRPAARYGETGLTLRARNPL